MRGAVTAPGEAEATDAATLLSPLPGLPPDAQLRIYRDGWFSRLRSALAEDFPGLEHALGHHGFDDLCSGYLRAHPSSFQDICRVGHAMAAYVAARRDIDGAGFLADLARLEWSITSVFDRADGPVLRPADLEGLPAESLAGARFAQAATADALDLGHPALEWLEAALDEGDPTFPPPRPCTVVVSRAGTAMSRFEVAAPLVPVLRAILGGATVEQALETAAEAVGDEAELAALIAATREAFARWVAAGLFASVEVDAPGA